MKNILLPTDFSREANDAQAFAVQVAQKLSAKVILLHVLEVPYGSFSVMGEVIPDSSYDQLYQTQLLHASKQRLDAIVESFAAEGVDAQARLSFGNPFVNIQETITEQNADLIIMGSKGASGLSEILVGSNAERVIRHATCPVLTVKGPADLSKIKSVALATDTTREQDLLVPGIQQFQALLGLNLHLVRVCTPRNFISRKDALSQLVAFAERNKLEQYTTGVIEAEFTDEGVIAFALEHNIQMIAMGTHGRTGLAHLFGGSIAEDVANHAHIPILTFRIPEPK